MLRKAATTSTITKEVIENCAPESLGNSAGCPRTSLSFKLSRRQDGISHGKHHGEVVTIRPRAACLIDRINADSLFER